MSIGALPQPPAYAAAGPRPSAQRPCQLNSIQNDFPVNVNSLSDSEIDLAGQVMTETIAVAAAPLNSRFWHIINHSVSSEI